MPGASFVLSFAVLLYLSLSHSALAFDYNLTVVDQGILYFPSRPLSSTKCGFTLTFNNDCDDQWWNFEDNVVPPISTICTWGPQTGLTFNFSGTGIELYGRRAPDGARFYISVDESPAQLFETTSNDHELEALLFELTTLEFGVHNVKLTYDVSTFSPDPDSRRVLGLDFWTMRGAPEGDVNSLPQLTGAERNGTRLSVPEILSTATRPPRSSSSAGLGLAAIAALVSVLLVTVVLVGAAIVIFKRRAQRNSKRKLAISVVGRHTFGPDTEESLPGNSLRRNQFANNSQITLTITPPQRDTQLSGNFSSGSRSIRVGSVTAAPAVSGPSTRSLAAGLRPSSQVFRMMSPSPRILPRVPVPSSPKIGIAI